MATETSQIPRKRSAPLPRATTRSGWLLEHLRQGLLDGKFKLERRLNEVKLSKELKTSRTPIRAALQMLAGEGLLRHTPNKGFTVREFPVSEIIDAYEMRALAEGLAARLAAERGLSQEQRHMIERSLMQGDALLSTRSKLGTQRTGYAKVNTMFHTSIFDAAGSDLVKDVVRLCQRMPQASAHNVMAFEITDIRKRHEAHHRIYEAILGREAREAENLMRQHILSVKTSMIRILANVEHATGRSRASAAVAIGTRRLLKPDI
jgi:GntR family transcriptional regulator, vanillate catabolism transcriptional regulator